jgi:PKD repeat protein
VAVVNCTAGVLQVSCSGAGSSDADGQDLRYSWEFGDGGVAGLVTTSHLYSAGGVYTVKLTVTSDNDTASATQVVEVVAPRLSLTSTSATEPDNHQTVPMLFTVRLDRPSPAATTVRWSTANGTATAGSDYQAASGTVTIPAGQTSANFTVTILGDKKREADESFRVTLTNPSGGAVIGQESTLATIVDDD